MGRCLVGGFKKHKRKRETMAKKLWSIFTKDMNTCFYTGSNQVERHHCIGKNKHNKELCELYGYIVPICRELHPNGANCQHSDRTIAIDLELKQACQKDYEEKHGTRTDFIKEFGRSYL